jgi:ATPase subunit of ABC transporter with duplicated ATPase domains
LIIYSLIYLFIHLSNLNCNLIILFTGAIVGVIGPNGAGKSTLIKMIMGKEKADSGSFVVGETVRLAVVDQVSISISSFSVDAMSMSPVLNC